MEIIVNGIKTHYRVFLYPTESPSRFAPDQLFLILHGWESNSERWVEVAERISRAGYEVIVPDMPGFGKSDPLLMPWDTNRYINWLEGFIKELNLKDYYLLGHSFGGALASKMAVKKPQEIKKLFLVSAACIRKKTGLEANKKKFFKKIAKIIKNFYFLPYYNFFRKAVYKFIIRKSDYVHLSGFLKETYLNIINEDLSFHLPFIKVPTVVIWGEKDNLTPIGEGQVIAHKIKGSKLVVIANAGHDLNRKQPEILAEKILENVS